jgi:hypothetical protein
MGTTEQQTQGCVSLTESGSSEMAVVNGKLIQTEKEGPMVRVCDRHEWTSSNSPDGTAERVFLEPANA